jgi:hypothetical protein
LKNHPVKCPFGRPRRWEKSVAWILKHVMQVGGELPHVHDMLKDWIRISGVEILGSVMKRGNRHNCVFATRRK